MSILAKEKVIVALDFQTYEQAVSLVEKIGDALTVYKVGLELYLNTNGKIIDYLHDNGKKVFLDLKFNDIENTVLNACKFAFSRNVFIFNIHASVGSKTMKAVAQMAKEYGNKTKVIAVTVLTNLDSDDVSQMYDSQLSASDLAKRLGNLVYESGMDGVVCSSLEAASIKTSTSKDFITVCPGIRPAGSDVGDQKRINTPAKAIENGADYLVIGRPVTQAENPVEAAKLIVEEVVQALLGK